MDSITEQIRQHVSVLGKSERYQEGERLWAMYWGIHYDIDSLGYELQDWEDDTAPDGTAVPLSWRKPSMRYGYGATLTDELLRLFFAPHHLPALYVERVSGPGEDPVRLDVATDALSWVLEKFGFWRRVRAAAKPGFSTGSGVLAAYLPREGRIRLSQHLGYTCEPVFASDPEGVTAAEAYDLEDDELAMLRIQTVYSTEDELRDVHWWLRRRDITPDRVINYEDLEITHLTCVQPPEMEVSSEVVHDLGFVPAVWVRTEDLEGEVDGVSVFAGAETILEAIDRRASQLDRACTVAGDPLLSPKDKDSATTIQSMSPGEQAVIGAKRLMPFPAEYVETSGSAIEAQTAHLAELKQAAQERTRIYVHDPERIKGTLAASAMEQLYQPTYARVRDLETTWGDAIRRMAGYLLHLAVKVGVAQASDLPSDRRAWRVSGDFGPVIPVNTQDAQEAATAATAATGKISESSLTRFLAPFFNVQNAEDEFAALEKEQAERDRRMQESLLGGLRGVNDDAEDNEPDGGGDTDDDGTVVDEV